jgi:hypothetical protein
VNLQETSKIVAVLEGSFPNFPTKPQTVPAYHLALEDLPYEAVRAAVREALQSLKFFPTPAELRAIISDKLLGLPSAEEAWGEVTTQVRECGVYRTPTWSCGAVQAAVRAIGYRNICMTEVDDLPAQRAHFYRTFNAYRERALKDADLGAVWSGGERPALAMPPERGTPTFNPTRDMLPSGERSPWMNEPMPREDAERAADALIRSVREKDE